MNDHPALEAYGRVILASTANALPEHMRAFGSLAQATFKDGALDAKTKELIALGIAIARSCDGCMAWHNAALHRLGVSRAEIAEAAGVAIEMGAGIALYNAAKALEGHDAFVDGAE